MKNLKLVTALLFTLLYIGCSNVENVPELEPVQEPESYTISLGMGDGTESRAVGSTIYGINVYFDKEKDGVQDDIYAYGLFDDPSKMTITLYTGYVYKFVCSAVKNGKNVLYYASSKFQAPFQTGANSTTLLGNEFIINPGTYLSGLGTGKAVLMNDDGTSSSVTRPCIQRYYGEVSDYTPVANGSVNIPLKKTYFGSRLVINGDLDGTVTVTCKIGSEQLWSVNTTKEYEEKEGTLYSYTDVYDCWKNESNYTATVTLNYDSNRGDYWDLSNSKTITFKRNVMTTITVNVTPDYSSGTFNVLEEEFGEEYYFDYEINGEGDLDVPVTPDEE